MRTVVLAAALAAFLAGCGGSSPKLGDGRWYGKLVSVDAAKRQLEFAPAYRLSRGRWVEGGGKQPLAAGLTAHPDLTIYFRPGGEVSAGHGQGASGLGQLGRIAAVGPNRDLPPGWFVTVRNGAVASVVEDSGIQSSGRADRRTFACVWSKRTQAFVR